MTRTWQLIAFLLFLGLEPVAACGGCSTGGLMATGHFPALFFWPLLIAIWIFALVYLSQKASFLSARQASSPEPSSEPIGRHNHFILIFSSTLIGGGLLFGLMFFYAFLGVLALIIVVLAGLVFSLGLSRKIQPIPKNTAWAFAFLLSSMIISHQYFSHRQKQEGQIVYLLNHSPALHSIAPQLEDLQLSELEAIAPKVVSPNRREFVNKVIEKRRSKEQ